MTKTAVKICGITDHRDALDAVTLGVSALGFIFAPSPRQISPEKAREIIRALPPFVKAVGVFVDERPALIKDVIEYCGLDLVQLHGDESPDFCRGLMPYTIKVLRIKNEADLSAGRRYKGRTRAFLLDTYSPDKAGGTGMTFCWHHALKIKQLEIPLILSGGLGPSNIADAIRTVRPYAVDVNSGVETRPGRKGYVLIKDLMKKVNSVPQHTGGSFDD
jgi:phosphoribosylanthranilate isomerase